ncbi:bifunctional diguanylate cyclase/phosphodiesterase [Pararhodospirillum oryzae]|uniref:GGDEF domain-containing protein n=1 Tax=Pararhodospirillum oryzae TaxID=478448 RepID=A0A512H6W0_9PROT|nr:sensor domain-containing diguanylate cyclase [Pararhodospirillum oryzae]GEO81196.1 hypothetical protein ROR02_13270 [Pararhodospirillum oryzae]
MNIKAGSRSLTFRVVTLCVAGLVLAGVGETLFFAHMLRRDVVALTAAQLSSIAGYVARVIDRDVTQRRAYLDHLAQRLPPDVLADPGLLSRHTLSRDRRFFFTLGLFIADARGIILGQEEDTLLPSPHPDAPFFAEALRTGFAVGQPRMGEMSGVPEVTLALPIPARPDWVLVGTVALRDSNFLEGLYTAKVGESGGLVLLSPRDRLFLGASDYDVLLLPTPREGLHPQHDAVMKGFRGTGIGRRVDGTEELAAIASVPSTGWALVARLPTREVDAPVRALQDVMLGTAGVVFLGLAVLLTWMLRRMLRPLRHGASQADRMTSGDIPFEPLPVARDDEVGHLTAAYNRLLSTLLQSRADMAYLAHHDPLTGLANRRTFGERLAGEVSRTRRHDGVFALLYLDLDGFKPINDTHGHQAGDEVLRQVAARLGAAVRREDLVARLGGDEFAVLLPDQGADEARKIAHKLHQAVTSPIPFQGGSLTVGVSVGIALYPRDGDSAEALLGWGDRAMYQAKKGKR